MPETLTASPAEIIGPKDQDLSNEQLPELFSSQESFDLFGVRGSMTDAIIIGDQTFAVFDISEVPTVSNGYQEARYPFNVKENGGSTGIATNRRFIIAQLGPDGRVAIDNSDSGQVGGTERIKGLKDDEKVVLGRGHYDGEERPGHFKYDGSVSRNHVEVSLDENNRPQVKDLGSTNGTTKLSREGVVVAFDLDKSTLNTEGTIESKEAVVEDRSDVVESLFQSGDENLAPNAEIQIGDQKFFISKVVRSGANGRSKAVLYTRDKEGIIQARFLYKSTSDGGWRVSSGIHKKEGSRGSRYGKGTETHYTQETKLNSKISEALSEAELTTVISRDSDIRIAETFAVSIRDAIESFSREIEVVDINDSKLRSIITEVMPGEMSLEGLTTEQLNNTVDRVNNALEADAQLERPHLMPDFESGPTEVATREHTILGKCTFKKYKATINGRDAYWDFGDDGKGRVWVDRIGYSNASVSSYGTDDKVINTGLITSKPVDYTRQATAIPNIAVIGEIQKGYTDITSFLAKLEPIKMYNRKNHPATH